MPVDHVQGGIGQASVGIFRDIAISHHREHISGKVVMNQSLLAAIARRRMVILCIHVAVMRMAVMVDMLGNRSDRLVMPRLMRAPRRARHDQRTDKHEKNEA